MTELHEALVASDLTTLRALRDPAGGLALTLAREFELDLDFSGYACRFQLDQLPCRTPRALGDVEARALLVTRGAADALAGLEALMRAGGHELVVLRVHARLGLRAAHCVHSSVLGRNNGLHALRAGGVRRHELHEPEHEVLVDGLNLGRAMSFKNAAAQLPLGGCKMVVQCAPFPLDDEERLGFLAACIDAGRFLTGPDMGFAPELSDALRRRFTRHIVGGARGPLGPTGTPTAHGCFMAIREAARVAFGSDEVRGLRVVVQGLGAVGLPLVRLLAAGGARLSVADPDPARVQRARDEVAGLEVLAPEIALLADADVVAPCALGGVLDATTIDRLRCRLVFGAANNQLRAVSLDEELALAERLQSRGILYQPDWMHNTAGVMAGFEEYVHGDDARLERVLARVERVCRDGTREVLREARETGRTPTAVAYARVERALEG